MRFAFWGAEESNLLGSEHYVDTLTTLSSASSTRTSTSTCSARRTTSASSTTATARTPGRRRGPPGSAQIEAVFNDYFASQGLATDPTAFDGRSDYGPFIAAGIPAGGLFSGAEGEKTAEQAAVYGGTAGEPYDPCYHQACDTINNLSTKALYEMGDAAAHAMWTLARPRRASSRTAAAAGRRAPAPSSSTARSPSAKRVRNTTQDHDGPPSGGPSLYCPGG